MRDEKRDMSLSLPSEDKVQAEEKEIYKPKAALRE